jgi:glycosyltransferase involved in cell wall biosynthesis
MKIAQVSPLAESVPPKLYGGTERIVSYLTEELVRLGHDVTLFASGDSITMADLVPIVPRALRLDPSVEHQLYYHLVMIDELRQRAAEFDLIHFHIDAIHLPTFRPIANKTVTTLHGRLDMHDLQAFYRTFNDVPLISISNSQRKPMPPVRWLNTVYHGLPANLYKLHPQPGEYLAFLGRISSEKQPDEAIAIAKRTGLPLKIAAKVDAADRRYYKENIEPLLGHPLIEFIGEISDTQKADFLGNAKALIFPIGWPEPFGITMIEAMACGTPVIAYNCGSVPEVVDHGITGYIVNNAEEAAAALGNLERLDRRRIRQQFEKRFTADRMTKDYLSVYNDLLGSRHSSDRQRFKGAHANSNGSAYDRIPLSYTSA